MITKHQQELLMNEAILEAKRAVKDGEAPIGCVLARLHDEGIKVVARGHNEMNELHCKVAHAEIVAFENAAAHKRPTLPVYAKDGVLVSTLEPCVMCMGASIEAGMKYVIFGLNSPSDSGTKRVKETVFSPESSQPIVIGGVLKSECRQLFEAWLPQAKDPHQIAFITQLLKLTK